MRRVGRRVLWLVTCLVASGGAAYAWGASAEERFAEAQSRFEAAQKRLAEGEADSIEARRAFHQAAQGFASIAANGVETVNLCVNAGNAYHFAGDNARALLWYARAEKLANTPEVRSGLATLRRLVGAEPRRPEKMSIGRVLMFWHYDLSRRTKQIFMLATYPLGCVLLLAGLMSRRRSLVRVAVAFMMLGGVIGLSEVVTEIAPPAPWAVVLEPSQGRSGNGPGYSVVASSIGAGQEVRIVDVRPGWVQIEMPTGLRCWVQAENCERI